MKNQIDVLIIGGGIAALQLARLLHSSLHVSVITKSVLRQSNSYWAQGGIAAVVDRNDRPKLHAEDTIIAGCFHHSYREVERLVEEGAIAVQQLIAEGLPVDRDELGQISLGLEGAHRANRIIHAGGDATGRHTIEFLLGQLPDHVNIIEQEMAYELLLSADRSTCVGVKTKRKDGSIQIYRARHVVLASGGVGAIYPFTTNQTTLTGDGIAMAFRAGAEVADMEFIQFHPTVLYVNGETKGLVSEAVRGAGGVLVDDNGNRLMEHVHPLKDLAPRHITAYEIYKARASGKGVYLDIRSIPNFETHFPTITTLCKQHGISVADGLLPVAPGSHFLMGGVCVDTFGRTTVPGLYAIGEIASSGVHGANRLASNSLLEGIVFGRRLANYLNKQPYVSNTGSIFHYEEQIHSEKMAPLSKSELQQRMMDAVGMIRSGEQLQNHLHYLQKCGIQDWMDQGMDDLSCEEIEELFLFMNSYLISYPALLREESRGAHIRSDCTAEEESWMGQRIIQTIQHTWIRRGFCESDQTRVHA
ncbi:L-aspartate oxidase [Bacillus sp. FJAT-42315]|uniref:L-aspartate oxidase n=1 Tax=Bacillus sp. FJAT-42315 TaxID=2014077 RepID=UPI000C248ECC|nr:L-aspartate oxidase [Bacillus sp. FJAT-42315]